jgi:hypothetical protein
MTLYQQMLVKNVQKIKLSERNETKNCSQSPIQTRINGGSKKTKKYDVLPRLIAEAATLCTLLDKWWAKVKLCDNFVKSANAKSAFASFTPIAQA